MIPVINLCNLFWTLISITCKIFCVRKIESTASNSVSTLRRTFRHFDCLNVVLRTFAKLVCRGYHKFILVVFFHFNNIFTFGDISYDSKRSPPFMIAHSLVNGILCDVCSVVEWLFPFQCYFSICYFFLFHGVGYICNKCKTDDNLSLRLYFYIYLYIYIY